MRPGLEEIADQSRALAGSAERGLTETIKVLRDLIDVRHRDGGDGTQAQMEDIAIQLGRWLAGSDDRPEWTAYPQLRASSHPELDQELFARLYDVVMWVWNTPAPNCVRSAGGAA